MMDGQVERDIRARVEEIDWWHSIELRPGLVTPGFCPAGEKLGRCGLPMDLSGQSVLDLGAWDGLFSFECAARGATRVLAVDRWTGKSGDAGFQLARSVLGWEDVVEQCVADVMEAPWGEEVFDWVLCLGLLYHLKSPVRLLEIARPACRERILVETHIDALEFHRPAAIFYPNDECAGEPSNWWGPNPGCVAGWLTAAGFHDVQEISQTKTRLTLEARPA